jgi:hypothetical protein
VSELLLLVWCLRLKSGVNHAANLFCNAPAVLRAATAAFVRSSAFRLMETPVSTFGFDQKLKFGFGFSFGIFDSFATLN